MYASVTRLAQEDVTVRPNKVTWPGDFCTVFKVFIYPGHRD